MPLNGKVVDLRRLKQEAGAAGVTVRDLGIVGDYLHTYDAQGNIIDVPPGMAAVLAAHVSPVAPTPPNYGPDAADIDQQAAAAVTALRAFINNGSPTNADAIANAKLQNRVLLAMMKRMVQ